ncbi:hypothetical protein [Chryseobacterium jejuense]|uniref:FG-GAP repeat n=1 Tax=Chryseobacterium jejuense TaxID=445960 RepID=A0A2X2VDD0_CHRJE|nr:hypothetical protein [Chryseobacterium jejuense]SDI24716.1 hypothetical protein SAMN05421542_0567 [Chryseobacterium jejuense]SQB26674.1 Uncharacterised protein [Chryseobacterium jejuense]
MKKLIITTVTLCCSFCMAQEGSEMKIQGDFDGNGTKEYAYIKVADCNDECIGGCDTTVYFSDKNIKPFITSLANGGSLYNLGDLNNDGKDDIGFYPYWCTSCWHSFYTYTLSKTGWKPLVSPIPTHCSQWEEDKFPIKKDPKKKGYVMITTSEWKDDDIRISSKSVKVN